MLNEPHPIFDAEQLTAGSVSKSGVFASLEFSAGDARLVVTFPVLALQSMVQVCRELDAMAVDAKNGVAARWHVIAPAHGPAPH
jgi:hypothetical protein